MKLVKHLKRSQFIVGVVRTLRGLRGDLQVVVWRSKRNSRIAAYLKAHSVKKMQLATSNNLLDGWLNTDIFLNHDPVVYLDATQRFPFGDNTLDYIIAEHMIEHIDYEAGQFMLSECLRVLKPGGRVRFATPDLTVILSLHAKEKTEVQRFYIDWSIARSMPEVRECKDTFVINNMFRAWGHCFLYDRQTLQHALDASGFRDIKFYKPGESEDPNLRNVEAHGREIGSEDMNQFETMVVEGCK